MLHYAANYSSNLKLFEILLQHVFSLPAGSDSLHKPLDILMLKNDAGQSILHMLVNRPDTFMHIKTLFGLIDVHLGISSPGSDEWDEKRLIQIYRSHIFQFDKKRSLNVLLQEKMSVLDQTESLSGRTPLFLALKQESISNVFLLLAHYADPMKTDRSGVDCAMLVKDEERYRSVHTYVMKASCVRSLYPIRSLNTGCKRKYIKRENINIAPNGEFEEVKSAKVLKQ